MATAQLVEIARPLFRKTELWNGVRVLSEHIPTARSVSVGAWIDVGSRDEVPAQNGASHFIEHMVFKGTRRRRMHHIAQRMEAVGGYLNAYTTKEYTCFYARSLDQHLDRAIDIVCDLLLNATFPEKELEREKGVVLEEIKMYEDVPEDIIFDRLEGVIYKDHALGRPVIGSPETVRSFTRDGLLAYKAATYTPDRIVFAVAGNVDHQKAVQWVSRAFESHSGNARAPRRCPVDGYTPADVVEHRPIQQAHLVLGTRGYRAKDERRPALQLLNTVLGVGMSSRLNQNIREKYGYCYSVFSFCNLLSDTGDFGVYMGTDPGRVGRARKVIFRELDRLAQRPVSRQRLAQAKSQLAGAIVLGLEDLSNRMMRLGRMELYYGRTFSIDETIADIGAVTADEVIEVAQDLFDQEGFSTAVFLPLELTDRISGSSHTTRPTYTA